MCTPIRPCWNYRSASDPRSQRRRSRPLCPGLIADVRSGTSETVAAKAIRARARPPMVDATPVVQTGRAAAICMPGCFAGYAGGQVIPDRVTFRLRATAEPVGSPAYV